MTIQELTTLLKGYTIIEVEQVREPFHNRYTVKCTTPKNFTVVEDRIKDTCLQYVGRGCILEDGTERFTLEFQERASNWRA